MPPQAANQHREELETLCADLAAARHVIVASNRGPVSFADNDGKLAVRSADAGPLSALAGRLPLTWVSVASSGPDRAAAAEVGPDGISSGLPADWVARLVSPSRRAFHRYYNVICNPLLWFMHHRAWGFTHTPNIDREAHTAWQQGFLNVSQMIAEEIVYVARRSGKQAAVLLRDYHMNAVAKNVRELLPDAVIHYAPGAPWPYPSDWMMLPSSWRFEIFSSLLACDVVDMTSDADRRSMLAGLEAFVPDARIDRDDSLVTGPDGHVLRVTSGPPTVDHEALLSLAGSQRVHTYVDRFSEDDRYTYVTTERAEPHKNIVRCVRAFGAMLDRDNSIADDARYLLVLAPPPPHLSQYRRYLSEIESAARDVNRKHRSRRGRPVELMVDNNYPAALAALRIADTVVSAPIADASCAGLLSAPLVNLEECTLIGSEASSATDVFGDEVSLVAPADVTAITEEMTRALDLADGERSQRFKAAESAALNRHSLSTAESHVSQVLSALKSDHSAS